MTDKQQQTQLTLGPVLFNWEADKWRDFYFKIADEAPVNTVYLGEVVCSKRQPFIAPVLPEVIERLTSSGKEVILSSLALVMTKRERKLVQDLCTDSELMIEANDMSAVSHLSGRPFVVGPFINVYNEDTMTFLNRKGAQTFCLPQELPSNRIETLSKHAQSLGAETETQIYGRVPLALSARCYHARAHGLTKDNCQFICKEDPNGMELDTMDDQHFMTVNGIQTMSYTCLNLVQHLDKLQNMGISRLRLSPQDCNMAAVASIFNKTLSKEMETPEANHKLAEITPDLPFSDGFFTGECGHRLTAPVHA